VLDKKSLIEALKSKTPPGEDAPRDEALDRLAAALSEPLSFDELEWELPPAARYLGPGVWMDAIKNAAK
jgi:hypothetical protein